MSATLAHPFRLDSAGSAAVIPQSGERHAVEIVRHIVACRIGERPLAPVWGISDPVAGGVDEADIRAAVSRCEPDIVISGVTLTPEGNTLDIVIDAAWRA